MKKIKIYALSTCLWCKRTKKFFEDRKISFEAVDYDKADEAEQERIMAEMRGKGGGGSFPYVCIGEEVVQGYDPDEFERLLGCGKK
ncbi:MAG: NrdH-redoxin [Elusimicrobia bacterium GWA2_56_46]|jgi:glutaredoxin|nr:MAG: NrdH-redoxin [Elusimicrobia bacterium GWA2_56_46]OGR55888.1 MAG: NrdH-redoxin [Elusimicrobia bacterium GWC2_56_31]HBB67543.1 NrdH-redoxin [Elusimicrobiota bacterium]HBW22177.1 NrdH-redoxin [Elusimicrobiota bacterium]